MNPEESRLDKIAAHKRALDKHQGIKEIKPAAQVKEKKKNTKEEVE